MKTLLWLFILFTYACGRVQENTEANNFFENKVEISPSSSKLPWKKSYSESIFESFNRPKIAEILNIELNQNDLDRLNCPFYNRFNENQKRWFWVVLMAAIAESESDFDNDNQTTTPGDRSVNIGLLQIDYRSANRHAKEDQQYFSADDLFLGEKNLLAGMYIMRHQLMILPQTGRIFPENTYYWEVLSHPKRLIKFFNAHLFQMPQCLN